MDRNEPLDGNIDDFGFTVTSEFDHLLECFSDLFLQLNLEGGGRPFQYIVLFHSRGRLRGSERGVNGIH